MFPYQQHQLRRYGYKGRNLVHNIEKIMPTADRQAFTDWAGNKTLQ